ncbi:unnamed protein product, partial [Amoebophrya sp. A120]
VVIIYISKHSRAAGKFRIPLSTGGGNVIQNGPDFFPLVILPRIVSKSVSRPRSFPSSFHFPRTSAPLWAFAIFQTSRNIYYISGSPTLWQLLSYFVGHAVRILPQPCPKLLKMI